MSIRSLASLVLFAAAASCGAPAVAVDTPALDRGAEEERVVAALDALHRAASEADGATYFALFHPDAVYYGTDATERWSIDEFRSFAKPYFDAGRGWTYAATERNVFLSADGHTAWFDERLWNEPYGETRGTGALVREAGPDGAWRFTQYNLSFPVPNDLARDLVARIRALQAEGAPSENGDGD